VGPAGPVVAMEAVACAIRGRAGILPVPRPAAYALRRRGTARRPSMITFCRRARLQRWHGLVGLPNLY